MALKTYTDHLDTPPYLAPGEHIAQHQASTRAWLCLRLATTPGAWAGLLAGHKVAPAAIDPHELVRQGKAGLWR